MYLQDYFIFAGAILLCAVFSLIASNKVNRTFDKYDRVPNRAGMSGSEVAARLLQAGGVSDIAIGQTGGKLSDHYHPTKKIVNLSQSTYSSRSIGAVAVAAHEIGHVMQKKDGYLFYRVRTLLVPVVNFGQWLSMPLVLIGLLLDWFSMMPNSNIGFSLAMLGVILYGGALVFSIVTLPVELNASRRASKMLVEEGILSSREVKDAEKVLSAAALTYLASMLISLVYFLRFLVRVLTLFGRRRND